MKKKILSLGVIAVLIAMLFVLTGCRNNSDTNTETNVQNDNLVQDSSSTTTVGLEIDEVLKKFDNGLALVQDENKYQYVIDESGKVVYENENKQDVYVSNGYISVGNCVYDNKGMVVAQSENKIYGNVSKSEYVAVQIKTEDVSGTTTVEQIEDLKGNKITDYSQTYTTYGGPDIEYLFEDFYTVFDRETEELLLINAKNNEIKKLEEILDVDGSRPYVYEQYGNWYRVGTKGSLNDWFINSDFSKIISNVQYYNKNRYECTEFILDKYMIGNGREDKVAAFDLEGNMVKDFTEIGKIKSITDYNNIIYVISETGYIYTMDSSFNYILQPTKTEYENLFKTKDGVWASKSKNIYLLNDKLEQGREFTTGKNLAFPIGDGINFIYSSSEGEYHDVYNIGTGKLLEIYR